MSTVDLTKVAGFKAVDAEGNDMGIVSLSEMTNMVKESIINEAVAMQSVSTLAETSTRAATDTYEDRLPTSDTFSYVRTLDSSGNPKRTSQNALATGVGGLIGTNTQKSNALIRKGNFCLLALSSNLIIEIPYSSNAFEVIERNTGSKAFICFRAYNNTAKKLECGTFAETKFMNDKENHKFYIKNTNTNSTREYIIINFDNNVSANIVQDDNYTFEEIILS